MTLSNVDIIVKYWFFTKLCRSYLWFHKPHPYTHKCLCSDAVPWHCHLQKSGLMAKGSKVGGGGAQKSNLTSLCFVCYLGPFMTSLRYMWPTNHRLNTLATVIFFSRFRHINVSIVHIGACGSHRTICKCLFSTPSCESWSLNLGYHP